MPGLCRIARYENKRCAYTERFFGKDGGRAFAHTHLVGDQEPLLIRNFPDVDFLINIGKRPPGLERINDMLRLLQRLHRTVVIFDLNDSLVEFGTFESCGPRLQIRNVFIKEPLLIHARRTLLFQ